MTKLLKLFCNRNKCLQQQSQEFLFEDEDCEFIIMFPTAVCDNLTLDIVIIQPKNNENNANEDREINNYIKQFHANASPTALICDPSEGLNVLFVN
ncbi:9276_t:CDS:2 [Racocetra fulgida]|uniref:9276_t:CDS:1 n=1 Tax=Racocetra fulgida TaxID=60492 RepID=A0A9N9D0A2_9GLOM|nr:9276_t:CDS:2 [Racocetra fulgida]